MMELSNFIILPLLLLSFNGWVLSDNLCDNDWVPYKDEKCLKIFDYPGLLNYSEAQSFCEEEGNATLLSIGFEEKQSFVEDFLKTREIADNVWIGLKHLSNGFYYWSDGTIFVYVNWASGSPKNDSDHCVQIQTDEAEFGKWSDVLCTKRNLVVCEKVQPWSLSQIQNKITSIWFQTQNLIPLGFTYVQLPKEKTPAEIWPWMTWADVTSDYAGVFFRAEGGNSSSFGKVQEGTSPRITQVSTSSSSSPKPPATINISANNQLSEYVLSAEQYSTSTYRGMAFKQSGDEVRPLNMAVRIWKRTQ